MRESRVRVLLAATNGGTKGVPLGTSGTILDHKDDNSVVVLWDGGLGVSSFDDPSSFLDDLGVFPAFQTWTSDPEVLTSWVAASWDPSPHGGDCLLVSAVDLVSGESRTMLRHRSEVMS